MWSMEKVRSAAYRYRSYRFKKSGEWERHPLHPRRVALPADDWALTDAQLSAEARRLGFRRRAIALELGPYAEFKSRCDVSALYAPAYREKKLLEHYLAFSQLELASGQVYVDVASECSPFPKIFRRKFGVKAYSQDLSYRPGIRGWQIGSSADAIPLPDASVDRLSLQCAFEHFEGDCDAGFIRETARLLRPGGRCLIVPLYVGTVYKNIIDPLADRSSIRIDPDAALVAERNLGGRFERVYSPASLERVLDRTLPLDYDLLKFAGVDQLCEDDAAAVRRVRYGLLMTKTGSVA